MRKKNYLRSLLAILVILLGSQTFLSCGDDDGGGTQETKETQNYWLTGTVRSRIDSAGFVSMNVLTFNSDYTVMRYTLYATGSVSTMKSELNNDGTRHYDGTWTLMEGHPEWSYFNGTINMEGGNSVIKMNIVNPDTLRYTVNADNGEVHFYNTNDSSIWLEPLYLNLDPSKNSWSELRNYSGWLMYIMWNPNEPENNSRFDSENNNN